MDEQLTNSPANRPITQRLCLVLASVAASDGADAGAGLVQHAMQLAQPQAAAGQVITHAFLTTMAAANIASVVFH